MLARTAVAVTTGADLAVRKRQTVRKMQQPRSAGSYFVIEGAVHSVLFFRCHISIKNGGAKIWYAPVPKIEARWCAMAPSELLTKTKRSAQTSVSTNNSKEVPVCHFQLRQGSAPAMARSASEARSPSRKRGRSLSREPSLGPPPVVVFNSPGGRAFRRVLKGVKRPDSLLQCKR